MVCPDTAGLSEVLTVVLVLALFTVWVKEPMLVEKLLSPE
jgi:hypothetical protein